MIKEMKKQPFFTVIMPYREDRGWLDEARQSVFDQDLGDDVQFIEEQGPHNQSRNVNNAMKKAVGLYTIILHEDDKFIDPSALWELREFIIKNDYPYWGAGAAEDSHGVTYQSSYTCLKDLLHQNTLHGGTCFYNTEGLKFLKFDESLDTGEEYDLNIRFALTQDDPAIYDFVTRFYRIEGQNKSLNFHGFESREQRKEYLKTRIVEKYEALYFNQV